MKRYVYAYCINYALLFTWYELKNTKLTHNKASVETKPEVRLAQMQ